MSTPQDCWDLKSIRLSFFGLGKGHVRQLYGEWHIPAQSWRRELPCTSSGLV